MACKRCGFMYEYTNVCPYCGLKKKQYGKIIGKVILGAWALFFVITFIKYAIDNPGSSIDTETRTAVESPQPTPLPRLQLLTCDSDGKYVYGKIRNNTNRQYGYVQVSANFYDKSGELIRSDFTNVNDLEPGKIWKFKIWLWGEKVATYKITGVSGW